MLLSTENWDLQVQASREMHKTVKISEQNDISVLVPASHDPRVRQIVIIIHHTYGGYSITHKVWLISAGLITLNGKEICSLL